MKTRDGGDLQARLEAMIGQVAAYNPGVHGDRLREAFAFAAQFHAEKTRRSGEPYVTHLLAVAEILAELRLDEDTLAAALLHDVVEDTDAELQQITTRFGADVSHMVNGVTKIDKLTIANPEARKAETYRKLILSTAEDPRTVLIKLADRLHNMRTIEHMELDQQRDIAQETMDVYAPLAHRFGIARLKWELEDRSFRVLQPERYFAIESGIKQTRAERERLVEELREPLLAALRAAGLECEVSGRAKHFYSIHRKMLAQEIELDRMFDLLALRVITRTKTDCYHALGVIHALYPPLTERIKDYIAKPKPNLYQSLHTTVQVSGGRFIEVQIRTSEMHERSELGIAAHWRYKEDSRDSTDFSGMVKLLRQIMEWQQDEDDPRDFMETLRIDFFQDEVFVFSPAGDVFQLPLGATPLDFAFAIHSEVGLHCVGAKMNGRIVSLRTPLENRAKVEILTAKTARPSTSWLEIVKTGRAKHHIRRWIKSTQFEESLRLGREILEREAQRHKLRLNLERDLSPLAVELGYSDLDKLLAAVGRGELSWQRVLQRVEQPERSLPDRVIDRGRDLYDTLLRRRAGGVRVAGEDQLMVNFARCCNPIPGDDITGVITRGRGVTVHRLGCPNLRDPALADRQIEVSWDASPDQVFLVKLIIHAGDRKNLLAEVSRVIGDEGANIQSGEFGSEGAIAKATLVVEVHNLDNLQKILKAVQRIPGIERIDRYQVG
ncbi:MAG TPA: bifunctional (p)ppGpp synthetase/guanosine-3',5'-bis(diphosphate) 3'-pyrophosphohydrolase [Candidatus Krumholzibacteria bacterium]|nr:bifunctional (p)ppGpp synthetase/guanosine-3',5'-bis(diphosphate) 3'-pyrophosphohydrolase [Candidatus Krumholzibacteria bacterium]HPD71108.1 bifunctional (p)ppGpp synthetase/guanosine-3',5'-bis(diphosphate) 3'-pyrophosphohydrolase [Candidatus Krumholzibacteria bacterium]HRY39192.1 bifunctional (p)ppGpp synthetase/guanosine-3',5'-bis(diphosphate) 3'-pyrophosphohydrolase [Candidatus Krumholzibacteria bacterium]